MEKDKSPDNFFTLKNTFGENIYIYYDFFDSEIKPNRYAVSPTIIINKDNFYIESFRNDFFNNNKKLWILVFKKSTLDAHTWQEIKDQGLYDKRYSFTLEELKAINFQIIYDGN